MTKEQRPLRAYQPWTDQEYGALGGCYTGGVSVDALAKGLSRYPSEVENALIRLKFLNEAMTNRTQAQAHVNAADRGKEIHEAIRNFPEHLIDHYEGWKKHAHDYLLRKARRLIINGKNYDLLLDKARKRVHLQIVISATLAGGK